MLNKLISMACPEESCSVRKKLSKHDEMLIRLHTALKALIAILLGIFIGSMFLFRSVSGQNFNQFKQQQESGKVIELNVRVDMLAANMSSLAAKVDALKSEADTTQAMGAGIGVAIMFLQLLGFFVKSRTGSRE